MVKIFRRNRKGKWHKKCVINKGELCVHTEKETEEEHFIFRTFSYPHTHESSNGIDSDMMRWSKD